MSNTNRKVDILLKKKIKKFLFINPGNLDYYRLAFYHRSLSSDSKHALNNERLEFLGDSVLSTVVAKLLFDEFPDKREGYMTEIRTRYIKREHLNKVGKRLGLHHFLNYKGNFNFEHQHILGNTFEALVGAIFLDKGFDAAVNFWRTLIAKKIIDKEEIQNDINYKGELINLCQRDNLKIIFVDKEMEKNGERFFHSTVYIDEKVVSEGTGISKKDSQKEASRIAYLKLYNHDAY